jgi:hypothetical protein
VAGNAVCEDNYRCIVAPQISLEMRMEKCWPPVFRPPAPMTARIPGPIGKPLQPFIPNAIRPPYLQPFPAASPLPPPGVPHAAAIQRLPSASASVVQRQKGDDAKLLAVLQPFLWPGNNEPPDDFFAAEDDDEPDAEAPQSFAESPGDYGGSAPFAAVPVQAKLLNPFDRARSGVLQCGKKQTPAQLLNKTDGVGDSTRRNVRTSPRRWAARGITAHTHGGHTYYHHREQIGTSYRTSRMEGPIRYHAGIRKATRKTTGKKNGYANGHLIAHSFAGPPMFAGNYVAMQAAINSAGGDWGRMETYIRRRLQQAGIAAYMVAKPGYLNTTNRQRPSEIHVSVYFNRSPYKVKFDIDLT